MAVDNAFRKMFTDKKSDEMAWLVRVYEGPARFIYYPQPHERPDLKSHVWWSRI